MLDGLGITAALTAALNAVKCDQLSQRLGDVDALLAIVKAGAEPLCVRPETSCWSGRLAALDADPRMLKHLEPYAYALLVRTITALCADDWSNEAPLKSFASALLRTGVSLIAYGLSVHHRWARRCSKRAGLDGHEAASAIRPAAEGVPLGASAREGTSPHHRNLSHGRCGARRARRRVSAG
jgi:hypothetical protein